MKRTDHGFYPLFLFMEMNNEENSVPNFQPKETETFLRVSNRSGNQLPIDDEGRQQLLRHRPGDITPHTRNGQSLL